MDRLLPSTPSAWTTRRLLRAMVALCAMAMLTVGGSALAQTYPGTLSNTATVTLPTGVSDPDVSNNSSTDQNALQAQADLGISKTILTPVPARAGSEVRYRIVVSNAGPSVATGVTVADAVPAQLQNVSWTCVATGAASSCATAAGTGNLSTLLTIAPSELVTLEVRGTAPAITPATITANTASLTLPPGVSDPSPGNNSSTTAAIQVQPPTLVANADTLGPVNGHAGAASVGSVLTNDTFDGSAATTALVIVTPVPAQNGVSIAEDGTVTLAPNTPAGTVNVPYTVCQRGNPGNCQSSTVAVQVAAAAIAANVDSVGPVVSGAAVQPNVGNVLLNDTFDGVVATTTTVQLTSTPNGPVSINADGGISVAANAAAGSYPVSYTICDRINVANCSTAVATVVIVAPPPTVDAVDDVFSPVPGASGVIGNVLGNDTLGGQPATTSTVTLTSTPQAPLSLSASGDVTLAPDTAAGSYQLTYQICQTGNAGNCDSATVTVQVAAPSVVAVADSTSPVIAGVASTNIGNVLANDTYNGGPATTANVSLEQVSEQGITIKTDGSVDVAASATVGVHTLNYTICSLVAPGSCSTTQLSVRVNAAPPVVDAVDDVITPAINASGTIGNVLANDTIAGQPATTATVTVAVSSAAPLSVTADGTINLAAGAAPGTYQLGYQICQSGSTTNCDTATITVHVPAPPVVVANDDSAGPVQAGVARTNIGNVLTNDTYDGGPAVATTNVTLVPVSAQGISINADGSIDVDAAVTAGTKTLSYTICSVIASSTCAAAQLSVQVNAAPPVVDAVDDVVTPALGASGAIGNVLGNDTIGGQAATTATVNVTPGSNGPLSVAADGSISLTAGTAAGTYQLSYQLCQVGGTSNCDTATITVHVPAPPVVVANGDSAGPVQAGATHTNIGNVLLNDTVDGAVATTAAVSVTQNTGGPDISIDAAGSISVAANVAPGTQIASYTICSLTAPGTCASAQVSVQVTAAPPTVDAVDDVYTVASGSSGNLGNVLANDLIGGATPTTSTVVLTSTSQAPLSLDINGNLILAGGAAVGTHTLSYQICDINDAGNCDTATVTVTVSAPVVVANPDTLGPVTAGIASSNIGNVLGNDTYNGSAAITTTNVTLAPVSAQGISINANGSVDVDATVTPGSKTLSYTICAAISSSACSTAQLTVQVAAAPPAVDAVDDVLTPAPGASGPIGNVLDNDTLGGQPATTATVTLSPVSQAPLTLSATGQITLAAETPAGSYQLTYQICESGSTTNCDAATVTVQVTTAVVQANPDTISPVTAGVARTNVGNVLANDTYNGSPALVPTNVTLASVSGQGITINSDGSVDVAAGVTAGTKTLSYTICSAVSSATCSTAQLTVQVVAAPLPIDAVNDVISVDVDTAGNVGNVLTNDLIGGSEATGATVLLTSTPLGPLSLDASGNVVLAADTAPGTYTLTYQICEPAYPDNCDVAVLTVQVRAPAVVANADSAGPVTAGTAHANVGNVLANDTYNGVAATAANVTLAQLSGGPAITIANDGRIDVAATAPAGQQTARYRICAIGSTTACAEADVSVQVSPAPAVVDAVDDVFTPASNAGGGVGNVLANDTLGGVLVQAGDVVVSANSQGPLSVSTAGEVALAADTAAGTYQLTYQLCAAGNASNCDSATITVHVPAGALTAANDSVSVVASTGAQTNVLNVLANDSHDGISPATGVTLAPVSSGPVSIAADGSVSIAANPVPGTYAVTYRICEVLNPATCADATLTVVVTAAPLVVTAVADSFGPVTGNIGGANVGNVLTNDRIGAAFATADNALVTPVSNGPLRVNADGSVDVAAGTGSGDYTVTYTVCERDAPANCGTALVTVQVRPAVIAANDDITAPVDGLNGGINIGNVLNNDTLGGDPATQAAVTLVPITVGGVTINADGSVDIAPDTPQGTVQITYQICERINASNCDTAIARITVAGATLAAVADSAGPIPGNVGGSNVTNVLANDSVNGTGATTSNVTLSQVSGGPAVTVQASGSVDVAAGLAAGSYVARYRICQPLNPGNCQEADVTVSVAAPPISAGADNLGPVDAASASVQAGNVLDNDLVGSQSATPANVTLLQTGGDAGISINPATGVVTVAAGTAVGSHTATYQICEQRNPTNCASGTVTVVVAAAPVTINAVDDRFDAVAATTGANNIGNVLVNDTLHGLAVTTANVVVVPASNAQLSVDVSGYVDVAPGTPVGVHTLAYRICETTNTSNCDTATITVDVVSAVLVASNDTAGPFSSDVGANHGGNLLFNDTLNGMPATTANVSVQVSTQGAVTINSDGTISVPAGTPAGTYPATYRVCELAYPANCAEATVSVVISAAPVVVNAMRDTFGPVGSGVGGTNIGNVLVNDEVNGVAATLSVVSVAPLYQAPVRLNADGSVDVDTTALAGTYTLTYQLCELADASNCDTAQLTVTVVGATVLATPDSFGPVNGMIGSANLGNVLANDTVNGQLATTASVSLVETVAGPLRVSSDGHVELAPGTSPGTYVLVYEICGAINAANCSRAGVTVTVVGGNATVDAIDDVLGPVSGASGGTNVGNVLTNDFANGVAATTTTVTVTPASNGPLTVNANGSVDVAGNTRVGSYSVNYQLCALGSTTDCDNATVTVTVVAASIIANNDVLGPALPGTYVAGNVLANDSLNGAGASLDLVSLTSTSSGPLTVENDGRVFVAASASPGTYSIRYRICERLNAGSCAEAEAQVTVTATPAVIAAANDSFGPAARGASAVGNVLANDTVGSTPASTGNVTLAPVSNAALSVAADGTVDVLPGAATGTQTLTYRICEIANPTNCADGLLSVQVRDGVLAANDDTMGPVNGITGAGNIGNVLDNDTVEGAPASAALVNVVSTPTGPLTINADGSVSLAANTAAGQYTASYQICEIASPGNCDSAVASVQVAAGATTIAANADSFGPVSGAAGSNNVGNVLGNDRIDGAVASSANVTLTATNNAVLSIDTQGVLQLAPGTAAGTYTIQYTICDINDASRCATATASVTVAPALIVANADVFGPIDGTAGGSGLGNVLANDTLDGSVPAASAVTVTSTPVATLSIDAAGNLNVAPGTPAGSYTLQYTVCELLNPANCSSAQVTVNVATSVAIVANPDSIGPVPAGPGVGNVLTNDTVNGAPATTAMVTLAPVTNGPLTVASDGTVSVTSGTPAGSYNITYQICVTANPTQCAQATAQVTVAAGTLLAQDDTLGPVGSGGGKLGNVLSNDTLGGTPVDTTRVSLAPVSNGPLSIDANGNITLAGGTATGTYTLTYTICERADPSNCDSAVLSVSVQAGVLVAADDTVGPLDGTAGAPNVINVLANDRYNDTPANATNVSLAPVTQGPLSVTADGQLSLAPGTPVGTYTLRYRICDLTAPAVCAEATVTVSVSATALTAADDQSETAQGTAVSIAVLVNDVQGGAQVNASNVTITQVTAPANGTAVSDGQGAVIYMPNAAFTGTDTFEYTVCESSNPANCATATVTVTVQPNQLNVVPDTVEITRPEPVEIDVLANDTTTGAPLDPPSLSIVAAPEHGNVQCNVQGTCTFTPNAGYNGQDRFTYRVCDTSTPQPRCGTATVTLTISGNAFVARLFKSVANPVIKIGGLARFTVRAENISSLPITNAMLINGIPAGFAYVPQPIVVTYDNGTQAVASARAGGSGITTASVDAPVRISAQGEEALVSTNPLTISGIDIAPGGSATYSFYLRAGASVQGGTHESDAILETTDGTDLTNWAMAEVTLEIDPTESESLIVGSVFADDNGNGIQDKGERGLPGVRVGSVEGLVTETDGYGRYHVVGISPGTSARGNNFILKVDAATLPPGASFTTPNPRVRRITAGLPTRFDFGVKLPPGALAASVLPAATGRLQVGAALFDADTAQLRAQHAGALDGMAQGLQGAPGTVIVLAGQVDDALWLQRVLALRQALAARLPAASVETLQFEREQASVPALRGRALYPGTSFFPPAGITIDPARAPLLQVMGDALARGEIDSVVLPANTTTPAAVQVQRRQLLSEAINARLPEAMRTRWHLQQEGLPPSDAGLENGGGAPTP